MLTLCAGVWSKPPAQCISVWLSKNNPVDAITPRGFVWVPSNQVKWQIFGELADKSKHNI